MFCIEQTEEKNVILTDFITNENWYYKLYVSYAFRSNGLAIAKSAAYL